MNRSEDPTEFSWSKAVGFALLAALSVSLAACASDFGGDFFPSKRSNLTFRQFVTVVPGQAAAAVAATVGVGSVGTGSVTARNGGTEGPNGGNVTVFQVTFDPFPNGAALILGQTVGTSVQAVIADNRVAPVVVVATFRGHDVNNNPFRIVTTLTASAVEDPATLGAAAAAVSGANIATLRPTVVTVAGTGAGAAAAAETIVESFPQAVAAEFTITNGISSIIDQITLQYFESDLTVAAISAFNGFTHLFLEANPINSGFTTGGAAAAGPAAAP